MNAQIQRDELPAAASPDNSVPLLPDENGERLMEAQVIADTDPPSPRGGGGATAVESDQVAGTEAVHDYAAIDAHNISLIYLRRKLVEQLLDDDEFNRKVIGAFVRIRVLGDSYRLVQVTGTGRETEKYQIGNKMTDILLEINNLTMKDSIAVDLLSNQEFTEEECKRLQKAIKFGLSSRLTVGDVQEKARCLHSIKVNDLLENEKSRLAHLRDRACERGHKKQLRECVEKMNRLYKPEERLRRLNEVPEIHIDQNMDPTYESAEDEAEPDSTGDDGDRKANQPGPIPAQSSGGSDMQMESKPLKKARVAFSYRKSLCPKHEYLEWSLK